MTILHYFLAYFKTNYWTFSFLVFLLLLTFCKYIKISRGPKGLEKWQLLLVLGVVLRVFWIGFSSHTVQTGWGSQHMLESDLVNVHAIELAEKGVWFEDADGQPSGRRPIGYPMFLALIYRIFGRNILVAWAANVFLYVLGAWALFLIAKRVFSERIAFWTSLCYAIYPVSIYSVKLMVDEHLFLPLWYWGLYLLVRELGGQRLFMGLLWYGLIFGYAAMTRTHAIFMPAVVALVLGVSRKSWKKAVLGFLGVLLVMQAINLPWLIRNYRAWGTPVLYTATSHYLYYSFNPGATPEGGSHTPLPGEIGYSEEIVAAKASGNPGLYHAVCGAEITRIIAHHPFWAISFGLKRALIFMGWNRQGVWPIWLQYYEGSYDPLRPISQELKDFFEEIAYFFYYMLFYSFLLGSGLLIKKSAQLTRLTKHSLTMLFFCIVLWIGEQMIIFPDRKYRFPLEPLMMIPAAFLWEFLWSDFRWEHQIKNLFKQGRVRAPKEI